MNLTPGARSAIADAVHSIVCRASGTDGSYQCKLYSSIGATVLAAATGEPFRAVGGVSAILSDVSTIGPVTQAGGQPLFDPANLHRPLAHIQPTNVRHAWIEAATPDRVTIDLSVKPALWARGSLPPGVVKVREPHIDEIMAGLQSDLAPVARHALWLALPGIVASLDYTGLKRLLERCASYGDRFVRRAYTYWRATQ